MARGGKISHADKEAELPLGNGQEQKWTERHLLSF